MGGGAHGRANISRRSIAKTTREQLPVRHGARLAVQIREDFWVWLSVSGNRSVLCPPTNEEGEKCPKSK